MFLTCVPKLRTSKRILFLRRLWECFTAVQQRFDRVALANEDSKFINQLYGALSSLLEGEALSIVMNTSDRNGLEAWRKINARLDPQNPGSQSYSNAANSLLQAGRPQRPNGYHRTMGKIRV